MKKLIFALCIVLWAPSPVVAQTPIGGGPCVQYPDGTVYCPRCTWIPGPFGGKVCPN